LDESEKTMQPQRERDGERTTRENFPAWPESVTIQFTKSFLKVGLSLSAILSAFEQIFVISDT
jgi:hypothetical protein